MIHTLRLDNRKLVTDFSMEPQIGDVIQLEDNSFVRLGNIGKSIPDFEQYITTEATVKDIQHINEAGTQANFNVAASLPNIVQGDLVINFKNQHSRFVALKAVTIYELDYLAISDQVEAFWKKHKLHKPITRLRTFLVGTVIKAQSGTYIYSMSANNQVVLAGKGNIPVSGVPIALEGKLDVRWEKSMCQKIISEAPVNCIFQALRKQSIGYEILG